MMTKNETLLCPLKKQTIYYKTIYRQNSDETFAIEVNIEDADYSMEHFCECDKEQCAWWNQKLRRCAINQIYATL